MFLIFILILNSTEADLLKINTVPTSLPAPFLVSHWYGLQRPITLWVVLSVELERREVAHGTQNGWGNLWCCTASCTALPLALMHSLFQAAIENLWSVQISEDDRVMLTRKQRFPNVCILSWSPADVMLCGSAVNFTISAFQNESPAKFQTKQAVCPRNAPCCNP